MPGNNKLQCYSAPALYTKQCEHPEVQLGGGPRPWARNAGGGCEGGRTRIVGPGPLPQTKTVTGAAAVRGGFANTNQMSKKCVWGCLQRDATNTPKRSEKGCGFCGFYFKNSNAALTITKNN